MASITENLQQLITSKSDIRDSIINKGVDVPENEKLQNYNSYIDNIIVEDPFITDVVFLNQNEDSVSGATIDVVSRVRTNGVVIQGYGVEYRLDTETIWSVVTGDTNNIQINENINHINNFDKITSVTISNLIYKNYFNNGILYEQNNIYQIRTYIIVNGIKFYSEIYSYRSGWCKDFDIIYQNAPNTLLNNTVQKSYIAVTSNDVVTKISLVGYNDTIYFSASNGYLGDNDITFDGTGDITYVTLSGNIIYLRYIIVYTNINNNDISTNNMITNTYYYYFDNISSVNYIYSYSIENIRFTSNTNFIVLNIQNCTKLINIDCKYFNINNINNSSLNKCYSLLYLNLPESLRTIGYQSLSEMRSLTCLNLPNITTINGNIMSNCTALISITIPDSLTYLQSYTFERLNNLININLPDNITTLYAGCLQFNTSLKRIRLPNSLSILNNNIFNDCNSLTEIKISNNITNLPNNLFYQCYNLSKISSLSNITSLGNNVFYRCYNLKDIELSNNITTLPNSLFYRCYSLNNIKIPTGVTSIGSNIFSNNYRLTSMIIPDSVLTIGENAFEHCYSLKYIKLPLNLQIISKGLFTSCYSLSDIVIPPNVYMIDSDAFRYCNSLTTITIHSNITTISLNAFTNTTINNIIINNGWNIAFNFTQISSDLDRRSVINIFNNLAIVSNLTLTFGTTTLDKLSANDKAIATNKGWILN